MEVHALLGSGADQSVVCPRMVAQLERAGVWMTGRTLAEAVSLAGFQTGLAIKITKKVKIDLEFDTYAGTLASRMSYAG